jgi:hypothetical protein
MPDPKKVFVVHGRNSAARQAMFHFLWSLGLQPIQWSEAVAQTGEGTPVVRTILESGFKMAQAVVVLLTGDDLGRLGTTFVTGDDPAHERSLTPQARQNVIFEAGMAFGTHPDRTIIVQLGTIRPLTDLGGVHMIRMDGSIAKRQDLASRLLTAGCAVDMVHGTDWHTSGDFQRAVVVPDVSTSKTESALSTDPRTEALLDRMKQAIKEGVPGKNFAWRQVKSLANKAGILEPEALTLLQLDKGVEITKGKKGSWLARLKTSA